MPSRLRSVLFLPLLLSAACSHEAKRENPLDPELTPAVTLAAALNDSSGTVSLTWSSYEGQQSFAGYRIERKVQGQEQWTTLDSVLAKDTVSWTSSHPIRRRCRATRSALCGS